MEESEYRIGRLRQRLAQGAMAELGLRIELRGQTVSVCGRVADEQCRAEVLRVVEEELGGLPVLLDVTVAPAAAAVSPLAEEL
jgi:hypothetical protein